MTAASPRSIRLERADADDVAVALDPQLVGLVPPSSCGRPLIRSTAPAASRLDDEHEARLGRPRPRRSMKYASAPRPTARSIQASAVSSSVSSAAIRASALRELVAQRAVLTDLDREEEGRGQRQRAAPIAARRHGRHRARRFGVAGARGSGTAARARAAAEHAGTQAAATAASSSARRLADGAGQREPLAELGVRDAGMRARCARTKAASSGSSAPRAADGSERGEPGAVVGVHAVEYGRRCAAGSADMAMPAAA